MSRYVVTDLHGNMTLFQQIINFIQLDDIVYCLGDNNDRGDDGWAIIKAILADKRFIYLRGNHEEMLCQSVSNKKALSLLAYNGGLKTYNDLKKEKHIKYWLKILNILPTYKRLTREDGTILHLSHAGFTPGKEMDLLWDRDHIYDEWPEGHNNEYIIHGHTPTRLLAKRLNRKWNPGAFYYCQGHKICLDNNPNATCLFNIDTFNERIFYGGEK